MARFLLATHPFTGHFEPGVPIAYELVRRGHEVHWYTGPKFQPKIEALGAVYEPMHEALVRDDADIGVVFPERRGLQGLAQLKFDLKHLFTDAAEGHIADLEAILKHYPAEALLTDILFIGGSLLQEKTGIPWAGYGMTIMGLNSRDTAPSGLILPPNASPPGRIRNHILNFLVHGVLFRDVNRNLDRVRQRIGLPARHTWFADALLPTHLFLQGTIPAFEYPRSDMKPQLHFIGPSLPPPSPIFTPPPWWPEVVEAHRPVILVTQGTFATDPQELVIPAIKGLANEEVLVIVTTGGTPVEDFPLHSLPTNVRLVQFVPFAALMPYVSVMVTNGGYGSTHFALANGVPLVGAGKSEDKGEICARIGWSGVGINLKTQTPDAEQVRQAVKAVLDQPVYRQNARQMQAEIGRTNAPVTAADLMEELVATRQPVLTIKARHPAV